MGNVAGTVGRSDVYKVDPKTILVVEGWNLRNNWGDLEALSTSIENNGVKQSLILRRNKDGALEVIDGERRLRATMMAIERGCEILSVPACIKPATYSQAEALVDSFVGNDGEPFDAISEAEGYRRFVAWGWQQSQIAARVGRSVGHINSRLKLVNEASPELREAVQSGEVRPTLATQIIKAEQADPEASPTFQADAVAQVQSGGKVAVQKKVKKPNAKLLKAMTDSIIEYFSDAAEVVKSYEFVQKPTTKGIDGSDVKDLVAEAYQTGRISMQAEMLGLSVHDLPGYLKDLDNESDGE